MLVVAVSAASGEDLEHGTTPPERVVAEAASCIGGPRSYERTRKPAVRASGKPVFTMITDASDG